MQLLRQGTPMHSEPFVLSKQVDDAVTVKFNKLLDTFKLQEDEADKAKDIEERMENLLSKSLFSWYDEL